MYAVECTRTMIDISCQFIHVHIYRDRKHFHPDFIPKLRKYIEKIFLDMSACTMLQEVNME
jgi:hypothetical protein